MSDRTSDRTQASAAIAAPKDLARFIDHTLLKPEATQTDIERLCDEAKALGFFGVCVNSRWVPLAKKRLDGAQVAVVSVVGFPLGAALAEAKAFETELAVRAGADEIDMVIAIGAAKAGDWATVEADAKSVVAAAAGRPVKAILETALLTPQEIAEACLACDRAGVAFVKTSTGFLGRGASLEDLEVMRASISPRVKIKASGGIKTFEAAKAMIEAGASRLGTSSGPALVSGGLAGAGY